MSRIGQNPVSVPKEVKIKIDPGSISLEGPNGKLSLDIPHGIKVEHTDDKLVINRVSNAKQNRANHGTIRSCLSNMVVGVTKGHKKDLEIQGIGFRANIEGKKIVFGLGFSHPVVYQIPEDVKVSLPNPTSVSVEGPDNARVGQEAAKIRALKPVEPYKGKGIRYVGEIVRRKQGKSVSK
ncbi:MAG: 50S ribosomal protein L6 [Candidatus Omnitrophica bacterium]|nr:50S ribosomal protein L6 [Candidatus Omnitrophota bacterium]MBU1995955.1 50S ribosomal protein L6 [Candidatus Omnitrophota bacterium]MBU4333515.1 50S ribosomal protein L6 [Candidatus Omnitrophota bacterium]